MALHSYLRKLKMGDRKAFEQLIYDTQNMIYGIAYSHVQDTNIAEDLAQETYLKAFVSLNGLKNPSKIKTWLASIAHHTAIDWCRKKKEQPQSNVSPFAEMPSMSTVGQDNVEEQERQEYVQKALQELRPDEREIIVLRYIEELSYKEIADTLNMTVTATGEKLCRIRRNLEEKVKLQKEDVL